MALSLFSNLANCSTINTVDFDEILVRRRKAKREYEKVVQGMPLSEGFAALPNEPLGLFNIDQEQTEGRRTLLELLFGGSTDFKQSQCTHCSELEDAESPSPILVIPGYYGIGLRRKTRKG